MLLRTVALLGLLVGPAVASAALNPETDKKYSLRIIMNCGTHNWLGTQFRADLKNDLAGILDDALGGMADVTVLDLRSTPKEQWTPIARDFDSKGFAALTSQLPLDGTKIHLLHIDFVNGQYEIQSRQFDGMTGMVSPVRREATIDRALVSRLAGRMIAFDFGIVGTIEGKDETVTVRFKGSSLTSRLGSWARKGDVFAVMRVLPGRGQTGERAERINDTIVQLTEDPKKDSCQARIVYRPRTNPLSNPGIATGFRCIRMATSVGPVRIRLVDETGQPHTRTLQVRLHSDRFQQSDSPEEEVVNPDRNGVFTSKNLYDRLGFARIVTGATSIARMPVDVSDDRIATIVVSIDAQKEQAGQLQFLYGELLRMYVESRDVQIDRFREVSALVAQQKNEDALKRATAMRSALDDDLRRLGEQLVQLKKDAGANLTYTACDKLVNELTERKTRINRLIGELEEAERIAKDPTRVAAQKKLQDLSNLSLVHIENNDYDAAIAVCKQIIKEFGEQAAVRKRLDELEKAWVIRSDEHRQARDFIFKEWPQVKTVAEIEAKLPTARARLKVIAGFKDELTLLKLRATLAEIGKLVRDEIRAVNENPDDMEKVAKLKKIVEDFDKFGQEVESAIGAKN